MNRKLTKLSTAIAGIFFIFIMLVSYLDPLSSTDDLNFLKLASDSSSSIYNQAIMYGNGRLLGNMLAMLMAKHMLLRTILKPAVMTCILFLIWHIFHMDNVIPRFISAVMLAILPDFLFAQTVKLDKRLCQLHAACTDIFSVYLSDNFTYR